MRSSVVREATVRQLAGLANNDLAGQVKRITDFVKKSITYVRDPVDSEYIVSPIRLLQQYFANGFAAGDCDDHVMLLNSMLGSIGFGTKFVGVKAGGSDDFNHVISGVMNANYLVLIDPCSKFGPQPNYTETLTV